MWILNTSKELLQNLQSQFCRQYESFQIAKNSLYHNSSWQNELRDIINQCFLHKNRNRRFKYLVHGYADTYFVQCHFDASQKYSESDVVKMLEHLIDNIFVQFGGRIFQQTIGIPLETNCAPRSREEIIGVAFVCPSIHLSICSSVTLSCPLHIS